jgi:nucleoside-diphosphate-sugar epimerase
MILPDPPDRVKLCDRILYLSMADTPYFMTGALGCIGAWVVKALVERGDIPVVFDRSDDTRRLRQLLDDRALGRVRFLRGDVTDGAVVRAALEQSGAQHVIHLAGLQVPTCKADPPLGALVNVVGTMNVFEAARAVGLKRVVYASSAAVFGLADEAVDETVTPAPLTHYGVFKQANEGNARVYYLDHGISSVGLRPFSVYGVGRDSGLTSDPTRAIKSAVLGRPFRIRFSGVTDFIYTADTAAAFLACADRAPDGAHVFNLSGDERDVADAVSILEHAIGPAARGLVSIDGPAIPMPPSLDDAALRAVIADLPRTPLEEGIAETVRRFRDLNASGGLDTADIDGETAIPAATGKLS